MKIAPQRGNNAQRAEESITHIRGPHPLRARRSREDVAIVLINIHRRENLVESLPVEIVEIRKMKSRTERISLKEIDFTTMQSKIINGLYFAGEILDVDGITGGFNFQNAWTTSWLAAQAMAHT